jgi:putative ABC transport system substrate-binding protein
MTILHVTRREFVAVLGGAAAWPVVARAQQLEPMRRIGVLLTIAADDPETHDRMAVFRQGLETLGWTEGRNIQFDYWFATGDVARAATYAAELVDRSPDLILANGHAILAAVLQQTHTIPVVFVGVPDPVGDGFVESLSRSGNNLTGFTNFEFSMASKWLQILRELVPAVTRVALLFNPDTEPYVKAFTSAIETAAQPYQTELVATPVHDRRDLEEAISTLARQPGSGMIVAPGLFTAGHHELIVELANDHELPAIYPFRYFAAKGGLISYGVDQVDLFRRAAPYVDRILRGVRPTDLPIQQPTKFELVINLKTAKTLGVNVPQRLLYTADEVIE